MNKRQRAIAFGLVFFRPPLQRPIVFLQMRCIQQVTSPVFICLLLTLTKRGKTPSCDPSLNTTIGQVLGRHVFRHKIKSLAVLSRR